MALLAALFQLSPADAPERLAGMQRRWIAQGLNSPQEMSVAPDGRTVLVRMGGLGARHLLTCWSLRDGTAVLMWSLEGAGHGCFSADGKRVIVHDTISGAWQIRDIQGALLSELKESSPIPFSLNAMRGTNMWIGYGFRRPSADAGELPQVFVIDYAKQSIEWGGEGYSPTALHKSNDIIYAAFDVAGGQYRSSRLIRVGVDLKESVRLRDFVPAFAQPSVSVDERYVCGVFIGNRRMMTAQDVCVYDRQTGDTKRISLKETWNSEPLFSSRIRGLLCHRETDYNPEREVSLVPYRERCRLVLRTLDGERSVLSQSCPNMNGVIKWALDSSILLWWEDVGQGLFEFVSWEPRHP